MTGPAGAAARRSRRATAAAGLALALLAAAAGVAWLDRPRTRPASEAPAAGPPDPAAVARGAVLATLGHCAGCHSAPGGPAYAGGRALATPWGPVWAGNLTPDPETGLGRWNADHFWRALHEGRGRDGRRLNPAFPYPWFTRVSRADSDDLFAYLRSLPAVRQPTPAPALRWPFGTQPALAVWRALFFRPGGFEPDPRLGAEGNRGAYLVQGLGHCGACHGQRNALGAARGLGGATLPDGRWHAPSLLDPAEAGAQDRPLEATVALLRDGRDGAGAVALGPMAVVVAGSLQHWPAADLRAVATYLQALPRRAVARPVPEPTDADTLARGRALWRTHCADCHDRHRPDPRTVALASPHNLVRSVVEGGFGAATAGHPRPYGMPPFGHLLDDAELAAVLTWLRRESGVESGAVTALEVRRAR